MWHGKEVKLAGPREANKLGIGMVHQHFMLIPVLSVTENIVLGDEPDSPFFFNKRVARAQVRDISQRYGLAVDPDAKVASLSVGQQQRVEILKVLFRGANLLILDEPTAVLTPQEIRELFVILKKLVAAGKTVVFITQNCAR